MSTVPNIKFYNNDTIPQIGFGTYKAGGPSLAEAIKCAYEVGYRLYDTAAMYKNEDILGDYLCDKRESVFITTKVPPEMMGKEKAYQSCQQSLKNLKTSYVDLILIHWPEVEEGNASQVRAETWETLEQIKKEKLARNIGVSNFYTKHLRQLMERCDTKPVLNQIELHPLCVPQNTIDYCKENGIIVESYSTLAEQDPKLVKNEIILDLSKKYNKSPSQICLKWGLQCGYVVIPKSVTPSRIKENFQMFDWSIDDEHMDQINGLNCDFHVCWNPTDIE